jgi:hypothetical protein
VAFPGLDSKHLSQKLSMIEFRSHGRGGSLSGAIAATFFGIFFAGIASFISYMIISGAVTEAERYDNWTKVPAKIAQSQIAVDPEAEDQPYTVQLRYQYSYERQQYTGDSYQPGYEGHDAWDKAAAVRDRYPVGKEVTAYVNPQKPAQAMLPEPSGGNLLLALLPALFPLSFVAIGVAIPAVAWWRYLRKQRGEAQSIAKKADPAQLRRWGGIGVTAFCAIFFCAGAGGFYWGFLQPTLTMWGADNWLEKTAKVERSTVVSESSDDGTQYRADVLYRYDHEGQTYRSDRVAFGGSWSSSDYDAAEAVVDRYALGKEVTAYVNPKDPRKAVLDPGWNWGLGFVGILTGVFFVVGLGGMIGGVWFVRNKTRQMSEAVTTITDSKQGGTASGGGTLTAGGKTLGKSLDDAGPGGTATAGQADDAATLPQASNWSAHADQFSDRGSTEIGIEKGHLSKPAPVTLDPGGRRLKKLLFALVFTVFWNGISWTIAYFAAIGPWLAGEEADTVGAIFISIFCLVGLGLLGYVGYTALQLFNPVVKLRLNQTHVPLGGAVDIEWWIEGKAEKFQKLTISLVGREEATYQQGTNTTTDKEEFAQLPMVSLEGASGIDQRQGQVQAYVPEHAMHSFNSKWNKVAWLLQVHGDIANWPDVKDEYLITVTPAEAPQAETTHG